MVGRQECLVERSLFLLERDRKPMKINGESLFAATVCYFSSNKLEERRYLSSIESTPIDLATVGLLAHSSPQSREAFHYNRTTGVSLRAESDIEVRQFLIPMGFEDIKDYCLSEFELLIENEAFDNWRERFGQNYLPINVKTTTDSSFLGWAQLSQNSISFLTLITKYDTISELTALSVFRGPVLAHFGQLLPLH